MEDDHADEAEQDFQSSENYTRSLKNYLNHQYISLVAEEEYSAKNREDRQKDHQQCVTHCFNAIAFFASLEAPIAE